MSTIIAAEKPPQSILDFTAKDIDGNEVSPRKHSGKVLLVVNVASQCGYTPQYKGLGALSKKYKERSSMRLGFPSGNFGGQEPGSDSEIKSFCQTNFGVTVDMFSRISVKGRDQPRCTDSSLRRKQTWSFMVM